MTAKLFTTIALAGLAVPLAAPAQAFENKTESAAREYTDAEITDVIERELLMDGAVSSNRVDVSTSDGITTLTGRVDNILAKERAAEIAETVKGVRSVINRVSVAPMDPVSDSDLRQRVHNALVKDPATDSYEIDVRVDDGTVILDGNVDSWTESELCATVAKGVKGVQAVTNRIEVAYDTERADAEITAEVDQALKWNALVDHALIDVTTKDGRVVLEGIVGSAAEKRQARYEAWTAGAKTVDASGLTVERWARDEDLRKDKFHSKPDEKVEDAIEAALVNDPRVYSFDVNATVSDGTATLKGVVDNLKAKRAAESVARNTVGVWSVRNHVKVRPDDERGDESIAADIRSALTRDPYVDRYEISVSVHGGTAYLRGTVDSYFEKGQADDIASKVGGVVDVVNGLAVVDDHYAYDPYVDDWDIYDYDWYEYSPTFTYRSDWEIERDIEDELFWSPFVDSDDVNVTVEDGMATLTGSVDSWGERSSARENAYEGGATYVRNELEVEPSS